MANTIDSTEERQLLEAVKKAVDYVDGAGLSPDAAIEKVARAEQFGPGKIKLIAYAYNTGRQTGQWDTGGNVLDKLASYPLADPDKIVQSLYNSASPAEKQAAARLPEEYAFPPGWLEMQQREKVARAPLPMEMPKPTELQRDPVEAFHRATGNIKRAKHAVDQLNREASSAEDAVRRNVFQLVSYFRKAAHDRMPFEHVECVARTYFGPAAQPLMDVVYGQARLREKRAGALPPILTNAINQRAEPFSIIRDCVKAAENCNLAKQQAKLGTEKLASFEKEQLLPFSAAGGSKPQGLASSARIQIAGLDCEKAASILGSPALGAAVGTMLGRTIGTVGKSKDDLVEDAWMNLEDPNHANEIRKIRAHTMLNELMTDPDDPISGYEPDRVLKAYNEISQVTPRVAENAATLRPALRRSLEGHTQPFESKELTDIEKGLAATRMSTPNTSILNNSPDSLLG